MVIVKLVIIAGCYNKSMNVGLPEVNWNEIVAAQGGHFVQSREWAHFQIAMGRTVLWSSTDDWSWLATVREVSGFRYLYVAYGPTVQGDLDGALASLVEAAKLQKADFVRIEPLGQVSSEGLESSGFKLEPIEEIEPAMTSMINLRLSIDELRHNLSSGHRNAINGAERRGISLREADAGDVGEFNRLIGLTAQKAGIKVHDGEYFLSMLATLTPLNAAKLYLAEAEGKVIAATIIFTGKQTWYYAHAASDPAYSKLQAGVPLLWQAVLDAKATGANEFDLWGVVAPDDTSAKAGYSRFKRAFGGVDKEYVGTWDLIVNPARYRVFKLARSASRVLRKARRI